MKRAPCDYGVHAVPPSVLGTGDVIAAGTQPTTAFKTRGGFGEIETAKPEGITLRAVLDLLVSTWLPA
jgi:hypothetical protein